MQVLGGHKSICSNLEKKMKNYQFYPWDIIFPPFYKKKTEIIAVSH